MKRVISQKRLGSIIKEAINDVLRSEDNMSFEEKIESIANNVGLTVEECDEFSALLYDEAIEINVAFDEEFNKAYVSSFKGGFFTGDPANKNSVAKIYKLMEELEK